MFAVLFNQIESFFIQKIIDLIFYLWIPFARNIKVYFFVRILKG